MWKCIMLKCVCWITRQLCEGMLVSESSYLSEIGVFLLKLYGVATAKKKKNYLYETECITGEWELFKKFLTI